MHGKKQRVTGRADQSLGVCAQRMSCVLDTRHVGVDIYIYPRNVCLCPRNQDAVDTRTEGLNRLGVQRTWIRSRRRLGKD